MTAANPQNPGNGPVGMAAAAGGNGYASFLLGYGSTTNTGNSNAVEVVKTADQDKYWAFYVGDTFNLNKKITLNLGARVDLQGNWTERHNRIVALDPTEASPLLAMSSAVGNAFPTLKGGYDLVASSRHPSRSAFPNWNHISPRLGVGCPTRPEHRDPDRLQNVCLPVDLRWNDAPHNLFINSITNPWLVAQSDGVTPKATLSNPFPGGIHEPLQRNQSAIDVQGVGNSAAPPFTKSPYMQQWNLDVQRQFKGDLLLDVAYAASKGTNLPMHSQDIDQLQSQNLPQNAADMAALTTLVPNPFAGNCTGCTGPVQSGNIEAELDDKGRPVAAALPAVGCLLATLNTITVVRAITRCN